MNNRVIVNKGIVSPSFDVECFGGNHVALNEDGDSGQSVELSSSAGGFIVQYNPNTRVFIKVATSGTTHTQTTSFSNSASLDSEPDQDDLDSLTQYPEDLARMWFEETTIGTYSFSKANMIHWYPCNDYGNNLGLIDVITSIPCNVTGHTAFYPLAENTKDLTTNYDATGTDIVHSDGYAIFNGTTSKARLVSSMITISPSISFWTKGYPSNPASRSYLIDTNGATNYYGLSIAFSTDNKLEIFQGSGEGTGSEHRKNYTSPAIDVTAKNNISIIYRGFDDFDVYINNNIKVVMTYISGTGTSISFALGEFKYGGNLLAGNGFYSAGQLSTMRVYNNRELTTNDVSEIYNASISDIIMIDGYTDNCREFFKNTDHGMSNLLLTQDATGRPTGLTDPNSIDFKNSSGAEGRTGLKPNLPAMTIFEPVLIGGIKFVRCHTWDDETSDEEYYIDVVVQATPARPDPDTYMILDDEACIGDHDTIEREKADFKVYTRYMTASEVLEEHNAMLLRNEDVLTETEGGTDYLTDENGVYLYED